MGANFFRANDWWSSKAALLMGLVYLYAAWFGIGYSQMLILVFLSVCTVSGFAATGYLCNDLFDIENDKLAGKRNFLIGKPMVAVLALLLITTIFAFLPWMYLPYTRLSVVLVCLQLTLLLIYSIPPVRLKERGLAGIITDSLYAHTVPTALSLYTFSLAAGITPSILPVIFLLAWQFCSGVRNILIHQYDDLANDSVSGVKNFMVGKSDLFFLNSVKFLISAELSFVLLLLLYLSTLEIAFWAAIVVVMFFLLLVVVVFYNPGFPVLMQTWWRYFPNPVFEKWLPVVFLLILSASDWRFLILAIVHITVFNFSFYVQLYMHTWPIVKGLFWGIIHWVFYKLLVPVRIMISRLVNFAIYYIMRLLGIDLVKEQMSVFQYLKSKVKGK